MTDAPCCRDCRFRINQECHRRAPGVIDASWEHPSYGKQFETRAAWPSVQDADWCGEFDLKPEIANADDRPF